MITLGLLCVFMTFILGIMVLMALGARSIAKDKRKEEEQDKTEKDEQ